MPSFPSSNREKARLARLHESDILPIFSALEIPGVTPIHGLSSASVAVLVVQLRAVPHPLAIVANSDEWLEKLLDNIAFLDADMASGAVHINELSDSTYSGAAENRRQIAKRLAALHKLATQKPSLILTTFETLKKRCLPKSDLINNALTIKIGDEFETSRVRAQLRAWGYTEEPEIDMPGTFSIRGDIVDIFTPTLTQPVRIERFGDDIDQIRCFDPLSQKTTQKREAFELIPVTEHLFDVEHVERAVTNVTKLGDALSLPSHDVRLLRDKLREMTPFWGQQAYTPAYYSQMDALNDYLPPDTVVLWMDPDECLAQSKRRDAFNQRQYDNARLETPLVSPPEAHWLAAEAVADQLTARPCLTSGLITDLTMPAHDAVWFELLDNSDLVADRKQNQTARIDDFAEKLADYFADWQRIYGEVAIVASSEGALERLRALLRPLGLKMNRVTTPFRLYEAPEPPCDALSLYVGSLSTGFRSQELRRAVLTENELLGTKPRAKRESVARLDEHTVLTSFKDLKVGDYVVHEDHGIGEYLGLVTLEINGVKGDFLQIRYAEQGQLYIPVQRLQSIQKYAGAEKPRRLDKLGGGAWERTKQKVRDRVRELAIDLLDLYAKRQSRQGFAFGERDRYYQAFEEDFPHTETPDQLKAINAVLEDMHKPQPMERLICGDVGFGKTEVAMRAAMRAVLDAKQVAVLVPTTLLAEQHLETFLGRFQSHPVRIESLNRFRKPKEVKQILKDLADGAVDIVIGTHRLLSKDVVFKNLGLLIIDEEHRFGVAHKEKIKALTESVDCLTMTATPIPRTFQMCLGGMKDLSIIETPPQDRLSIHTFVARESDNLIREAIEREINRGGQVYFLHNRVEELESLRVRIQQLVPTAKIEIAHGQMDESVLEKTMFRFIHHDVNVLLCTTIIESGIDIPTANCLIVSHAERFGLAQLYQIRGRVGRSSTRAYCYLMTGHDSISQVARERLKAIERLTDLGSGLEIAYLDLEMRGCGDLLGAEQSGNIASVGLEMYAELMQEAVASLSGQPYEKPIETEVNLPISAYLPDTYIEDVQLRLLYYKRLANATSNTKLYEIFGEIIDRFGAAPKEANALRDTFELRIMLAHLGIQSLNANHSAIILDVGERSKPDPLKLMNAIVMEPQKYAFRSNQKFVRYLTQSESKDIFKASSDFLNQLSSKFCVTN